MNSRDEILKRLKENGYASQVARAHKWQDNSLYVNYPKNSDDLFPIFKEQIEDLSGEVHLIDDLDHFTNIFLEILKDIDPGHCRAHKSPLVDKIKRHDPKIAKYLEYVDENNIDSITFSKFNIGITCADSLIARTGSILLRTLTAGGRRLSVLPPTHMVIAETNQLVCSLDDALRDLSSTRDNWSYSTIITGPSRTSDIEKQLVLGAHGPKRLIVLLLKSS